MERGLVHGLVIVQDDDAGFFCTVTLFLSIAEVCVAVVSWYRANAIPAQRTK